MLTGRQLLLLWAAFFVGVVLGEVFVVNERFYVLGLATTLLTAVAWRLRVGTPRAWLIASLFFLVLIGGVGRMELAEQQFADSDFQEQVGQLIEATGQVIREPDEREAFTQLFVRVEDDVLLVRTDRFAPVRYGDIVQFSGVLEQPEAFVTDSNRLFDYPNYLKARGVQYVISFATVRVIDTGGGNLVVRGLLSVKDQFATAVTQSLPPPASDLGLGLLLGIKQALGDELETAFRHTGLIHIVVLSGYNVMLVVAFFWWLSAWVLPLRGRVLFGLVGIWLFALMVGLSATVVRASVMASILMLAKYIGARYDVLKALLLAGLVMVVLNPYLLLYDLGFQLSFMATLGLVLFLPHFEGTVATETKKIGLRDIFLATLITQVFVLPLLLFHIGEVSLVAVLVNMLVLPIVALAMVLTFATGLVALVVGELAAPVAAVAYLVLTYIILVVEWFDRLPFAAVTAPPISLIELCVLYGLLGVGWYYWQQYRLDQANPAVDLSGWVIETETETAASGQRPEAAATPIIFR